MSVDSTARYGIPIDLTNDGDSRARVLHLVRPARTVLELGASVGLMTQVMHEWGIRVTTVEYDPQARDLLSSVSERVIIGDLDSPDTLDQVGDAQFDLVLASDVLEHLKDPLRCLTQAARFAAPDGRVILSIPNVAHGDIRLALLMGRFEYADLGLLDRTHIRFFTRATLADLIARAGLVPTVWHRTERPIGESEIPVPPRLVKWGRRVLADDPDADTYQWIVECRRADGTPPVAITPDGETRESLIRAVTKRIAARVRIPHR